MLCEEMGAFVYDIYLFEPLLLLEGSCTVADGDDVSVEQRKRSGGRESNSRCGESDAGVGSSSTTSATTTTTAAGTTTTTTTTHHSTSTPSISPVRSPTTLLLACCCKRPL